ncbi:MAG TPA: ATP-binding protein, partial [Candidatus Limnocylindria bacterium]|nr:ATP-binding protein [Candidatus Limnocylindria bacterium]
LIYRAKDISTTLGIVIRSQRRFGNVVSKERLESALSDLVRPGELNGIALFNSLGDVVASAGVGTNPPVRPLAGNAEYWGADTVALMNLVDLGTNVTHDIENMQPTIVVPRDLLRPPSTNRFGTNGVGFGSPPENRDSPRPPNDERSETNRARGRQENGRPRFARPPWMSEPEYEELVKKKGVHSFLVIMSTKSLAQAASQDFWLRLTVTLMATVSVGGLGFAWRNMAKSSDLQIRLVRASEVNTHLKEMNLAAAGLAHETRNPLNIIRGMAHMISKMPEAPASIRERTRAIMDETDKVTAQLNEFINYSRPREVQRVAIALPAAVTEVVRALDYDIVEKTVRVTVKVEALSVEADEQMFRQVLFNLMLNAIQAVEADGEIEVVAGKNGDGEVFLEIRDNGPGVPPERRKEIFKPYFTTHQKGTGLGLAVVQQIVLAQGWEIECLSNEPRGANFRITHLKLVGKS